MKRSPVVGRASGIFLLPMERKDNTSGGIWSMAQRGSLVPITAVGSFDVFRGSGAPIFALDASPFDLQDDGQEQKSYISTV